MDTTGGSAGCEGYEKTGGTRKKLIADYRRHSFHSYVFYGRAGVKRSLLYYTIAATRSRFYSVASERRRWEISA